MTTEAVQIRLAMAADLPARLFAPDTRARLHRLGVIDFDAPLHSFADADADDLARLEVLLTGWGSPVVDEAALAAMPRLRAIVHAAGSVRAHVTPPAWARDIVVSSAAEANALPVAEFTLASILFAGKNVFRVRQLYRDRRAAVDQRAELQTAGNFHRRIGLVGASRIGRRVRELLRPFDLDVLVYDPYLSAADAAALDVTVVDLNDLFRSCEVVSVHAPLLPHTVHMIGATQLALLGDGSTLINTARGALIDQAALMAELKTRRINAVLDVTDPEVPEADSALFDLPNLFLTPHIGGALGNELYRLGHFAAEDIERFAHGEPLRGGVTLDDLARMA
jgi:phosphoglycerate dehydrogenase-like enzyme